MCALVLMDVNTPSRTPSGEWATLKWRPTPAELDRVNFAGKKLTQAELEASRSSLEAEGLVARRNYTGGFAAALKRATVKTYLPYEFVLRHVIYFCT